MWRWMVTGTDEHGAVDGLGGDPGATVGGAYRARHTDSHVARPADPLTPGTKRIVAGVGLSVAVLLFLTAGAAAEADGSPGPTHPQAAATTISSLSAGAPLGARTLAPQPTQVAPAPVVPAVITGLAANGIPNVALNAYRVAAARLASADPSCGIDWSLIAGIGRVESDHGQFGGATLNPDGTSTPKIIGPALDGKSYPYIGDTDHGVLDGDRRYDNAVGPMQFIPSTWKQYASDGNGDGISDPFNINDAALATARYLCAAGGNLRTTAGQYKAVMAYNHSDQYVNEVLALAAAYASGVPVAGIPISGPTTGALPPIDDSGPYFPPANPIAPPALVAAPTGSGANSGAAASTVAAPIGASAPTSSAASVAPSAAPSAPGHSAAPVSQPSTAGGLLPSLPIQLPTSLPAPSTSSAPSAAPTPTATATGPLGTLVCTLLGVIIPCA